MVVVSPSFPCLAVHDAVDPAPAEEGGEEVPEGIGDVQQADDEGGVVVWRGGEGGLDGDVEDVETAEGDAGVVDG